MDAARNSGSSADSCLHGRHTDFRQTYSFFGLYGPALTTNVSANEAKLDQRTPFCSGDEQSRGGVREAFLLQKGDAGNITSALQLEVSQPVGWGDAQRSVGAVWSFQPAYGSDVYRNSHGAVPQYYFNTRLNSTGNLSGRISPEQGAED